MTYIINKTEETKDYWAAIAQLSGGIKKLVLQSDVLIVPLQNYRENVELSFHQGTLGFHDYLKQSLSNQAIVEICIEDSQYQELALHSNEYRLNKLLVNVVIAPMIIGLLTNYAYDVLKANPTDTVKTSLGIYKKDCSTIQLDYDGPVNGLSDLNKNISDIIKQCENGKTEKDEQKKKNEGELI
jgi:hypothetical protein